MVSITTNYHAVGDNTDNGRPAICIGLFVAFGGVLFGSVDSNPIGTFAV